MSALMQLRLAALCAVTYAALVLSGLIAHFQRTGSFRTLFHGIARPEVWVVVLVALLVTAGLWTRRAWAWWLGVAAAGYQLFRIVSAYVLGHRLGHVPAFAVLIALVLLVLFLVLVLQRKARLGCNR